MYEIISKRTLYSKTFQVSPDTVKVEQYEHPVHVLKDGVYVDLDSTIKTVDGKEMCDTLPYTFRAIDNGIRLEYGSTWAEFVLKSIGDTNIKSLPIDISKRSKTDNTIWITDLLPGVDLGFVVGTKGVRTLKRLKDENAPRSFTWSVTSYGDGMFFTDAFGRDNENEIPTKWINNRRDLEIITKRTDPVTQKDGTVTFEINETWTGRVYTRNPKSRILGYTDDPIYPVTLDPTVGPISADADNGDERVGSAWTDRFYRWYTGKSAGVARNGGVRFLSLTVPQGSTITSATIDGTVHSIYGSTEAKTIYGDDVDNAPTWSNTSKPSSGFTQTTASTTFNPSTSGAVSSDVTAIVQEIVDRAGWVSGNAMRFAYMGTSGTGYAEVAMYAEVSPSLTAKLTITYTTGSTFTATPMMHMMAQAGGLM